MKKYIFTIALLALALTACNKEAEAPQEEIGEADATVYQVSIPASMGADTKAVSFDNSTNSPTASTSFQATDKVYLYNKTTSKWISYNSCTSSFEYLSPSNLTSEGKSCDLTGNITGTISEGDEILLLYNMNHLDPDPTECAYNYRDQDGTAEGVLDGAIATLKVKAINGGVITFCQVSDENDDTAHFQNLQSMFRFKFTAGGEPINVKRFYVWTENAYVASSYMPIPPNEADYDGGFVGTSLATASSDYIFMGLYFGHSSNDYDLGFNVTDADGKVYTGSRAAPSGGFQNGRYYYNTNAIDLTYQYTLAEPTITWITPSVAVDPSFANWYIIPDNNADITLSGTSMGYGFWLQQNATVRLNDFTGTYPVTDDIFLEGDGNLTIEVNGTNSIVNANDYAGICTYMGDVKLCGNGTLSITSNDENHYGIEADNYDGTDVSVLAALGHTVTRSARTDNLDGTYTWTYTVVNHWVHLNELAGNYTAQDGDWLTGELPSNLKLEIAAGATVTLAGMTHHAGQHLDGITCLGNANIILAAETTNDLTRGDQFSFCGIGIDGFGATLTISGTGTLRASGGAECSGIGGGYYQRIVINGGSIIAAGGSSSPGIGSCVMGSIGNITISSGVQSLTVQNDPNNSNIFFIGAAKDGTCGTVTIDGRTSFSFTTSTDQFDHFNSTLSSTVSTNDTWTLTHK